MRINRRSLLLSATAVAITGPMAAAQARSIDRRRKVSPVPARHVRLKPSPFADAFAANRRYLLSLDPERLLHNFYVSAGLPAPKPVYGGWEAQGIAGHSLGHWLSACALVVANTGDREVAARLDHALSEMARIQRAHGDGYIGGTTVERGGKTVDGKVVFEELRHGTIRSGGFDLNGGWVPLYTWHKIHAGLLDAHSLGGNPRALPVALKMAGYLAGVLEALDDAQLQRVMATEFGGLNDSYAETYALTGDDRWLRIARRLHHKAVMDPIYRGEDRLQGLHANTQIPKVIGAARLHELTGVAADATAARFFHDRVTNHHSYVVGGNSLREHFGEPDALAGRIGEATCEACNSYNMLKLTRHLYGWHPDARLFDYYERVQVNHILAHQRPDTGAFAYFMPLSAGARRSWSTPEDSFWCCVGSGMESHAKHADSIWWHDAATLYVNLYIASSLDWADHGLALDLDTRMPLGEDATLTVRRAPRRAQGIALRVPGWAEGARVLLNGLPAPAEIRDGHAVVARRWRVGDRLTITLPRRLRAEPVAGDPSLVAFTHGPLVLAADLGDAAEPFHGIGPALVTAGAATDALARTGESATYTARDALGGALVLRPFHAQYDRRTAVYFPTFSPDRWNAVRADYVRAQDAAASLARRTVDIVNLGEMQPERDHGFVGEGTEVVNWAGRPGRRVPGGKTMRVTLARRPGPAVLRVLVSSGDAKRPIDVTVDGAKMTGGVPIDPGLNGLGGVDFPVPTAGERGRVHSMVEFTGSVVVYEVRMLTAPETPSV